MLGDRTGGWYGGYHVPCSENRKQLLKARDGEMGMF